MADAITPTVRLAGITAAVTVAILCLMYAIVLAVGLLTLPSPDHQIQEPWFTLMECLIIVIAPAMVWLTVALHAWAPAQRRPYAMVAVAFMIMSAVITCSVHFAILTLSRQPVFAEQDWAPLVFSFRWPSLAYALDILAWDVFFAFSALFAGATVRDNGIAGAVRILLYASAALALAGLAGIPLASMQIRNIGIAGYAVLFPAATTLLAVIFYRTDIANTA